MKKTKACVDKVYNPKYLNIKLINNKNTTFKKMYFALVKDLHDTGSQNLTRLLLNLKIVRVILFNYYSVYILNGYKTLSWVW